MAVTRGFFFLIKRDCLGLMCQVVSYERQYGYGEQNLQGNDKMAAEGNPKTTQQPPKLPQTAPTPYYD